jgi:16S rRNA (cytosine1402-N4)-methyltransferase
MEPSKTIPADDAKSPAHVRRPRYRGRNPRRFEEKYKEHNPARYPADVEKIIASGKTPAGSHRPICVREVLEMLAARAGEIVVDATLGYGGHALELARVVGAAGKLIGLDVDDAELRRAEARLLAAGIPRESLVVRRSNFAGLPQVLAALELSTVDMVLADLGVSSMQIDDPARGFSIKFNGPLDMRMNPSRGRPAADFLADLSEAQIIGMLEANADEPHARAIARAICEARGQGPIARTSELARVIRGAVSGGSRAESGADTSVRRVFQALRIAVNDEFGALEMFLRQLPACLNPGGRVAILTFHSGEDRRVKKAFQAGMRDGSYSRIAEDVIRPGVEEVRANPRASSAKLRWAVRA